MAACALPVGTLCPQGARLTTAAHALFTLNAPAGLVIVAPGFLRFAALHRAGLLGPARLHIYISHRGHCVNVQSIGFYYSSHQNKR